MSLALLSRRAGVPSAISLVNLTMVTEEELARLDRHSLSFFGHAREGRGERGFERWRASVSPTKANPAAGLNPERT
jgi:hypothetical protein